MSCDLSDPAIGVAFEEIVSGQATNWLILGYHDTRDKISLYSKGTGGLDEFRNNLKEEVLYGYLRIESKFVLITYTSEQVSGVRKARALVHGRAIAAMFKANQNQISASNLNDLSEVNVRNRLKLSDDRPSSPAPGRKATMDQFGPSPGSPKPQLPSTPKSPEPPEISGRDDNWTREEAERQEREREATARRDAERVAKEAAAQRQRAEDERRRQEVAENVAKDKAAAEARAKADTERKAAEQKRNELIRNKTAEMEKSGKVQINGYITVQGGDVYFWKRRWFELRGKTLYLYRDESDKLPISKIELDGDATKVEDAQSEVLILNSFKIDFRNSEPYYFFSDNRKGKEEIVAAIQKCVR